MIILKIGYESYSMPNLDSALIVMDIMNRAKKADYAFGGGGGGYSIAPDSFVRLEITIQRDVEKALEKEEESEEI
jgi:hypothetical protein